MTDHAQAYNTPANRVQLLRSALTQLPGAHREMLKQVWRRSQSLDI
jgi:hypothetical protein